MLTRLFKTDTHLKLHRLKVEAHSAIETEWQTNLAGLIIKLAAWGILLAIVAANIFGIGTRRAAFPELHR